MSANIREKLEAEKIVKDEPAMWVDSASVMQNGRLILTSKHLVFMLNDAQNAAITIDLDTINAISNETVLVDSNIMSVTYLQYDNVKFSVLNYEDWEKAIEGQRIQPHI
ncbi:MAG: hypothetical protein EOP56_17585 [Sphingobacteriales bacterium]|nr:MAG: hypothetical protein EOP56_17585 [Sphingobacteriales bacterium]